MATEREIRTYYQNLHDTLTASYSAGTSGLTEAEFNRQHGQIWDDMEAELISRGYLNSKTNARDEKPLEVSYREAIESEDWKKALILYQRLILPHYLFALSRLNEVVTDLNEGVNNGILFTLDISSR